MRPDIPHARMRPPSMEPWYSTAVPEVRNIEALERARACASRTTLKSNSRRSCSPDSSRDSGIAVDAPPEDLDQRRLSMKRSQSLGSETSSSRRVIRVRRKLKTTHDSQRDFDTIDRLYDGEVQDQQRVLDTRVTMPNCTSRSTSFARDSTGSNGAALPAKQSMVIKNRFGTTHIAPAAAQSFAVSASNSLPRRSQRRRTLLGQMSRAVALYQQVAEEPSWQRKSRKGACAHYEENGTSPVVESWSECGHISRDMPEDLYSGAILSCMNATGKSDFFLIALPMIVLMLFSSVIQAFLLVQINGAVRSPYSRTSGSHHPYCLASNPLARHVCLFTYIAVCLRHVRETGKMFFWLAIFKHEWWRTDHQPLRVQRETLNDPESGHSIATVRPLSHITGPECVLYITTLFIKLAVEGFALIVGSGAVLWSSADLDLILNTLAATFILELDDILYDIFVAKMWTAFCTAPELTATLKPGVVRFQLVWPYLALAFVVGWSVFMEHLWCVDRSEMLGSASWWTPEEIATNVTGGRRGVISE